MDKAEEVPKSVYKSYRGTDFYNLDTFDSDEKVLQVPSMPHISPMYLNTITETEREILSFRYKTSPEVIAKNLPEPLVPFEKPVVLITFAKNNGTDGFYNKVDMNIPCYLDN